MASRNIIILDGNNELGVELTRQWLSRDPRAEFYVVSRYGTAVVKNPRVTAVTADPTDLTAVDALLPDVPYMAIIDLASSPRTPRHNDQTARCALALANSRSVPVIGYAAGRMGAAAYRLTERDIAHHLKESSVAAAMVRPPYIYSSRPSAGRRISATPKYTFVSLAGHVARPFEPLDVSDAAEQLIDAIVEKAAEVSARDAGK